MESEEPEWSSLIDLASDVVGGVIVFATDEFFAPAKNLLHRHPPVFIPDKYTAFGKWMDGWESRRKRVAGHDWSIIKLGIPGTVTGIEIDTAFFTGNHSPRISVQGAFLTPMNESLVELSKVWETDRMGKKANDKEFELVELLNSNCWKELIPFSVLRPGYEPSSRHFFTIHEEDSTRALSHLRLNMYPDGGIARIRVRGKSYIDFSNFPRTDVLDLASILNGGLVVECSNSHFGGSNNLILPGRGNCMGDGWETSRKLSRPPILTVDANNFVIAPGHEYSIIKLGTSGHISRLVIDTHFFRGNFPESVEVDGLFLPDHKDNLNFELENWIPLLIRTKVIGNFEHFFDVNNESFKDIGCVTYLRLKIFPDGGIMRLKAFGTICSCFPGVSSRL